MWIYLLIIFSVFGVGMWMMKREEAHGPNSANIVGQVFEDDAGNYWRFHPEVVICPLDTSIIPTSTSLAFKEGDADFL